MLICASSEVIDTAPWRGIVLEAIARRADERAARARQRMILVDARVIDAGEVQLVGHIVEIELQLEMLD